MSGMNTLSRKIYFNFFKYRYTMNQQKALPPNSTMFNQFEKHSRPPPISRTSPAIPSEPIPSQNPSTPSRRTPSRRAPPPPRGTRRPKHASPIELIEELDGIRPLRKPPPRRKPPPTRGTRIRKSFSPKPDSTLDAKIALLGPRSELQTGLSTLDRNLKSDVEEVKKRLANLEQIQTKSSNLIYKGHDVKTWIGHIQDTLRSYRMIEEIIEKYKRNIDELDPTFLDKIRDTLHNYHNLVFQFNEVSDNLDIMLQLQQLLDEAKRIHPKIHRDYQEKVNRLIFIIKSNIAQYKYQDFPDDFKNDLVHFKELLERYENLGSLRLGTTFGGNGSKKK